MAKIIRHITLMLLGFGIGYIAGAAMYAYFVAEHYRTGGSDKTAMKHQRTTIKKGANSGN